MVRSIQFFTVFLAVFFLSGPAQAADSAEFVMLIDLSSRMAERQAPTAQAIRDLAITGIHGRMQDGQTLTIWFYDNAFSTNMPPLAWDSRRAADFANRAEQSFRARKFLRASRPKGPTLQPVVGKTSFFTAIVLTDGYLPFSGTPFDAEINSTLLRERDRFAKEKKPFLVTLVARNGQWAAFGVHTNLGAAVELPVIAQENPVIEKALAVMRAALTNSAPPKPKPAPVVEKLEEPKVAVEKPIVEPTPPPKIETPPVEVAKKPIEMVQKPVEKTPETNAPVVKTTVEPPPAEPPPRIEVEVPKPKPAAPIAVAIPPAQPSSPWPLLLASFGVIVAVSALIYMKVAQPRPASRGSLISQSLDAEHEGKPPRRH